MKLLIGKFDEIMTGKIGLDGGERPGGVIGLTSDEEAVLGPGSVGSEGVGRDRGVGAVGDGGVGRIRGGSVGGAF